MTSEVIASLINAAALVAVAIIGKRISTRIKRVERSSTATLSQVANDHDTNLREEADERHEENKELLQKLNRSFTHFRREVRDEFSRLRGDDAEQRERIHDLEKTNPRWKDDIHHE